jgi:hypothetical protein
MPTTIVSERERGVWRRYRMTPASTRALIASSVLVRFLILLTAGLLQIRSPWRLGCRCRNIRPISALRSP